MTLRYVDLSGENILGSKFSSYIYIVIRRLHNNAFVLLLKPSNSVFLSDLVSNTNSSWSDLASGNSISRSDEDNIEVHTEDTCWGVVLQSKINVLSDTESEATCVGEIYFLQLVLFDLQTSVKNFVRLESTDLQYDKWSFRSVRIKWLHYQSNNDGLRFDGGCTTKLTVTWTAIFSFLLMPNERTV